MEQDWNFLGRITWFSVPPSFKCTNSDYVPTVDYIAIPEWLWRKFNPNLGLQNVCGNVADILVTDEGKTAHVRGYVEDLGPARDNTLDVSPYVLARIEQQLGLPPSDTISSAAIDVTISTDTDIDGTSRNQKMPPESQIKITDIYDLLLSGSTNEGASQPQGTTYPTGSFAMGVIENIIAPCSELQNAGAIGGILFTIPLGYMACVLLRMLIFVGINVFAITLLLWLIYRAYGDTNEGYFRFLQNIWRSGTGAASSAASTTVKVATPVLKAL